MKYHVLGMSPFQALEIFKPNLVLPKFNLKLSGWLHNYMVFSLRGRYPEALL
jgi:hypothetical protein